MTHRRQNFMGGAAILAGAVAVTKLLGALYKIPLGNLLDREGMAHFYAAYNIYSLLLVLSTAGLPVALSRMVSRAATQRRYGAVRRCLHLGLALLAALGLVCSAVMCLLPEALAAALHDPDAAPALRTLGPAVLLVCLSAALRGYSQGLGDMVPTAAGQVAESAGKLLIGLGLCLYLLFLCAAVQAVDNYQDLLRLSVATAGNDHRLGANEAPPAVISIFLGDELTAVLDAIETDTPYSGTEKTVLKLGVHVLPKFTRDTTDRNRTSPFAFTGNKFEFRMVGSSDSIACANIMLNAAMAETLKEFSDRLEGVSDFESALHDLIKETIKAHKRIIFNGNGYDDAWIKEATEKRGLLNLRTTPDALATVLEKKNVEMLTSLKIFSEAEIRSRYEICLENYCKTVNIEGLTMVDMVRKEILPAVEAYLGDLSGTVAAKTAAVPGLACKYEKDLISKLSKLADEISDAASSLDTTLIRLKAIPDVTDAAYVIRDVVLQKMAELRVVCDEAESITADKYWPFPTYGDLLFGVR